MKTRKTKQLGLLLAAVLCFGLLPAAAEADTPCDHSWYVDDRDSAYKPATCTDSGTVVYVCAACGKSYEEKVPALGHSWNGGVITRQPTCSQEGVRTYTCSRCGVTTTEAIARTAHTPVTVHGYGATCTEAGLTDGQNCSVCGQVLIPQEEMEPIGHRWDDGKLVKAPERFSDGEMLYTCLNNPAHTRTETVSAVESLFSSLRRPGIPKPESGGSPLVITLQPEGGLVRRFPSDWSGFETRMAECVHTFTVTAEGGKEPYTYEWHKVNVEQYEAFEESLKTHGSFLSRNNPYDRVVKKGESSLYEDSEGGYSYYCVISDADGRSVTSDSVELAYALAILKQPQNHNEKTDSGPPSVEVIDGQPPYSFQWYRVTDAGDEPVEEELEEIYEISEDLPGYGSLIRPPEEGAYYCVITDSADGEVTSRTAAVYSADELEISSLKASADSIIPGQENVKITAEVKGGVPPYTGAFEGWNIEYTEVDPVHSAPEDVPFCFTIEAAEDDPEIRFTVTDSMGKQTEASIELTVKQLEIRKQPESGTLPYGKTYPVFVEMAEGKEPFTYELYRLTEKINGSEISWYHLETTQTDDNNFDVDKTGLYYIHITDADGRFADSDTFRVGSDELRIIGLTGDAVIPNDYTVTVLFAIAAGGNYDEDYTFDWYRKAPDTEGFEPVTPEQELIVYDKTQEPVEFKNIPSRIGRLTVRAPGEYCCCVSDADGNAAWTDSVFVTYTGEKPIITRQPEDQVFPFVFGNSYCSFSCRAVGAAGVRYKWQKKDAENMYSPWLQAWYDGTSWHEDDDWGEYTGDLQLRYELSDASQDTEAYLSGEQADWGNLTTGLYRCMVIDLGTGNAAYSKAVNVTREMRLAYQETHKRKETEYDWEIRVEGGTPAYTIEVTRTKWFRVDGANTTISRTEVYPLTEKNCEITILDGDVQIVLKNLVNNCKGEVVLSDGLIWRGDAVEYSVKVTDAQGQVVTNSKRKG